MNELKSPGDKPVGGAGYNDKLLVVGYEKEFSDFLIKYSIQMASTMGYSIVALNLLEVAQKRWLFSKVASDEAADEEMAKTSDQGAGIFAQKADDAKIGFESLFRKGPLDDIVREVCKQRGDIDLVLLEPEFLNIDPEDPFSIPAYTLVPNIT
jgi:hypothetical protein